MSESLRRVLLPRSEDMKTFQQALHSHGNSPSLNMTAFCKKPFRSVREVRSEPQYLQFGLFIEEVVFVLVGLVSLSAQAMEELKVT